MDAIVVDRLGREFQTYEKAEGLAASFRNLFARKPLIKRAVAEVSFTVAEAGIVGFLGPNGAGKTTTLKILSGIMPPTSGTAQVLGHVPWKRSTAFRRQMAIVMGQRSQLWPDLPARETFALNRAIYDLDKAEYRSTLDDLVAAFGVEAQLQTQVRRLSLGERMKMELVASLLHRPKVLFLDEPTIGLDLVSQKAIRDLVRTLPARWGTTVMLTSHYVSDIEDLCERVILINRGRLVYDGALEGIRGTLGNQRTVRLEFSEPVESSSLAAEAGLQETEALAAVFEVPRTEVKDFCRRAFALWPVADLTIEEAPLEEAITRWYQGADA
jgi:ABC-2 type transport system ATP-binding protein